jgi:hypothetical protein
VLAALAIVVALLTASVNGTSSAYSGATSNPSSSFTAAAGFAAARRPIS